MDVTLVTGASSGIGRSLARRLARRADGIVLVARRAELLNTLAGEIDGAGGRALALACDVTEREQVAEVVARAERDLGPVTRLVANAGGGSAMLVDDFDARALAAVVGLNLVGVANCVDAVLPGMLARGDGHLVAMGSLAGRRGLPSAGAYCAAKGGLANFMESLRVDLRSRGIAVTLLQPGFVRTKPGGRHKPFQLDLETATARMERAIVARRPVWSSPWPLVVALMGLRLLPSALSDRILAGRSRD